MESPLGERLGIGRGAEVFAFGEGRVIKLLREPEHARWLTFEFAAQRAARQAGVPAPEAFELREADGRPGLVMERVDGLDCLATVDRQPWRLWSLGTLVGRLHASLAGVPAPDGTPSLRDEIRHDVTTSERVPASARERLLAILEMLPEGDRLCHMDFHPANVLLGPRGPVVIDFASARRGVPIADYVKSVILFEAGEPPEMTFRDRVILRFGRRLMRAAYQRGYGRLPADDARAALAWRAVIVGQRLGEGIPEERRPLLRMLSRALRAAEA